MGAPNGPGSDPTNDPRAVATVPGTASVADPVSTLSLPTATPPWCLPLRAACVVLALYNFSPRAHSASNFGYHLELGQAGAAEGFELGRIRALNQSTSNRRG